MILCIVVDNERTWFGPFAERLVRRLESFGSSYLLRSAEEIPDPSEVTFFLSCERKIAPTVLARSRHNLVVHASDLPEGKGMSPMTWQVLEGKNTVPVTLFEAVETIDAGTIYLKDLLRFQGNELITEMQAVLGTKVIEMCERFMSEYPNVIKMGAAQTGSGSSYRRRTLEDSRLDPEKTIAEQFNLLRVVDNERYPAFFEWKGRKFVLKITASADVQGSGTGSGVAA